MALFIFLAWDDGVALDLWYSLPLRSLPTRLSPIPKGTYMLPSPEPLNVLPRPCDEGTHIDWPH